MTTIKEIILPFLNDKKKKSVDSIIDNIIAKKYPNFNKNKINRKEVSRLKSNFNLKWKSSQRTLDRFIKKHQAWLEKKIYIFEKPKDKIIPTTSKKTTVAKNKAKKEKNLETDKLILATIKKTKTRGKT